MEWEICWGGDPEDVLVSTSGIVTLQDLDWFTQAVLSDPRYRSGMAVIVDHRKANWSMMTTARLRGRVDSLVRDVDRFTGTRVASVVRRPSDYGVGRMMAAFDAGQTGLSYELFLDMEMARAWLREPAATQRR